jgi:hypothetical protein
MTPPQAGHGRLDAINQFFGTMVPAYSNYELNVLTARQVLTAGQLFGGVELLDKQHPLTFAREI